MSKSLRTSEELFGNIQESIRESIFVVIKEGIIRGKKFEKKRPAKTNKNMNYSKLT